MLANSRFGLMTAAVAVIGGAFVLRLPFLHVPLTADEGGYAEIARLWARGAALYRGVWVDRPQGLLVTYRGALAAGATSVADLRVVAAGAGAVVALLVLAAGWLVFGRRGGILAASLATCAGASPYIEGFTFCGELIAAVAAAGAIAALLVFDRWEASGFLILAGVLAGSALMIKQSAFDALGAGIVALGAGRPGLRGQRLGIFAAAAVAPVAAGVAASGNAEAWYQAVIGYGLHASHTGQSAVGRLSSLAASLPALALALGVVISFAAFGWRQSRLLVRAWASFAVIGVLTGGSFHPHYYLQLVAPLALLAAAGLLRFGQRVPALTAGTLAIIVLAASPLWLLSGTAQASRLWPTDRHLQTDAAVAREVRALTPPNGSLFVIWAAADLYYLADRRPAFPYLWLRNVQTIAGAVAAADRVLALRLPSLVVEAQPASIADPSGRTAAILRRAYRVVRWIHGTAILEPRLR